MKSSVSSDFFIHDLRHLGLGNNPQGQASIFAVSPALALLLKEQPLSRKLLEALRILTPLLGSMLKFALGLFLHESTISQKASYPSVFLALRVGKHL